MQKPSSTGTSSSDRSSSSQGAGPYVRWFADIDLAARAVVGGKAASLGALTRAGFPVPAGFAVTTAAFTAALDGLERAGSLQQEIETLDIEDLEASAAITARVRERVADCELPPAVREAVLASWRELCGSDPRIPVAIRSSATGEDAADASFAGLQATYLWVRGEQSLLTALRACWASWYSLESVSYRRRRGMVERDQTMAVVVQHMVDPLCAGVMFTRSPVTGDRSVIAIEGSWGLGSCIVSGEVTPDLFVVNKVSGDIIKRVVSVKSVQHVPASDGVETREVNEIQQTVPCLTDALIAGLASVALAVEHHYGTPQDIEWAIALDATGTAQIHLLQSRPETTWAQRDEQPVAVPKDKPFDHVLAALSGGIRPPGTPAGGTRGPTGDRT